MLKIDIENANLLSLEIESKMKIKYLEYFKLKKIRLRTIIIGIIVIVLLLLFFSSYGIVNRIHFNEQRNIAKKELIHNKLINDSLKKKIKDLKYDTLVIERVAREKYGLIKKGEKVYIKKK